MTISKRLLSFFVGCIILAFTSCGTLMPDEVSTMTSIPISDSSKETSETENVDINTSIPEENDLLIQSVTCAAGSFYLTYVYEIESVSPSGLLSDNLLFMSDAPLESYTIPFGSEYLADLPDCYITLKSDPTYVFDITIKQENDDITISGYTYKPSIGWLQTVDDIVASKRITKIHNSDTLITNYWNGIPAKTPALRIRSGVDIDWLLLATIDNNEEKLATILSTPANLILRYTKDNRESLKLEEITLTGNENLPSNTNSEIKKWLGNYSIYASTISGFNFVCENLTLEFSVKIDDTWNFVMTNCRPE